MILETHPGVELVQEAVLRERVSGNSFFACCR